MNRIIIADYNSSKKLLLCFCRFGGDLGTSVGRFGRGVRECAGDMLGKCLKPLREVFRAILERQKTYGKK